MYKLTIHNRVRKKIKKIPLDQVKKIREAINLLLSDPFNNQIDITKVDKNPLTFRCRVGDYRFIYVINKHDKMIDIRRVEHRQWDYKNVFTFFSL